jgi:nitroimidazol reductase NimA-like FMN-containing flavoprotein (pyridoxamine 5'-phosphate oxidase superfamily)
LTYTQSPHLTTPEIETFLRESKTARFCSLNKDGSIHATPVWYNYENGKIIIATPPASRKARNVKRNRNVTVLIDSSEGRGWPRGVIIYGKAELDPSPIQIPEAVSLMEKYRAGEKAEAYARGLLKLTEWIKITVKPERLASFDYNKDKAYQIAVEE